MADVLVVADDLTGANAAAAGFSRSGLRSVTVGASRQADVVAEMVARFDVVVATTDTRHAPQATARDKVAAVVRAGWPTRLVCNRIDTTLRGNIGATTEALRDAVAELSGRRTLVLCAPAHPNAGRQTVGGHQLLDGKRLEETEVAHDARTPVRTSDVVTILGQQTAMKSRLVPMATVTGSSGDLVSAIREAVDDDVEVLVADAMTTDHLCRVATAAVAATADLDVVWVTSDPGPASVAMAKALGIERDDKGGTLLVVSGSATVLTREQLRRLAQERDVVVHRVPTREGSAVPDLDPTTALLGRALDEAGAHQAVVLATVLDDADVRSVTAEEAEAIPAALARAVRRNLEEHDVGGIFSTGGDVTAALLGELGSHGLEISDEIVPLAVAGSVVGGPWDGLPIVTKGGLVGDATTTVACVDHLRGLADVHRRQVTWAVSRTTP